MPVDILTATNDGVAVAVWVVPGSSRTRIDGVHGDRLKVRVTALPEGGKANQEVERVLAERLGTGVTLKSGMRSRTKVFLVPRTDIDTVRRKLDL